MRFETFRMTSKDCRPLGEGASIDLIA
jgi:hypothetical protein